MKSLFILLFFISFSVNAFEFTPSVMNYGPKGRTATQKYTIHNSLSVTTAVEIKAMLREIDMDGKETLIPTEHFSIYPKLLKMKAGETRVIKVTYNGKHDLNQEQSYRIIAEQLSVDLKKKVAKKNETSVAINFLYKYETSAYVTPENAAPQVEVENYKLGGTNNNTLEVVFKNTGNAHQVFQDWKLEVETSEGKQILDKKNTPELNDFNLLAGNKFRLKIPWNIKTKGQPKSVSYKLQ